MANSTHARKNKHVLLIVAVTLVISATCVLVVIPACTALWLMTGTYDVNTVRFTLTDPSTATSGADGSREPGVWIDTSTSLDTDSKTIESSKPYSVGIDHTDTTFKTSSVEFTKVKVTYDDGSVETTQPSLPLVIPGREFTATNSVGGGRIVKTKMRLISGRIPNVITRDEPFTLEIEGHFNMDDGSKVPFEINQHYDVEIERTRKKAWDVMQDT